MLDVVADLLSALGGMGSVGGRRRREDHPFLLRPTYAPDDEGRTHRWGLLNTARNEALDVELVWLAGEQVPTTGPHRLGRLGPGQTATLDHVLRPKHPPRLTADVSWTDSTGRRRIRRVTTGR